MEVEVDGRLVDIARRRERSLLAVLLLSPNTAIPTRRLIHLLWDGEPGEHAGSALHSHISRLRGLLRTAGGEGYGVDLLRDRTGYRIQVAPDLVDIARFRALLDTARGTADPAGRAESLRAALALWRGQALSDTSDWLREQLGLELEELRLAALEERIETDLALGRHADVLPELFVLAAAHPLRQRLIRLHMLALHRAGRSVEALDVYARTRLALADQLGLDPGAELVLLQDEILQNQQAAARREAVIATAPVPAQLPRTPGHFTGRYDELARLDELAAQHESDGRVLLIAGPPGMGKTALAVHWTHQIKANFPDGQLFVDLRGNDQVSALPTSRAVAQFLRALGVPPDRVPVDEPEQIALYRSIISDRRVLVVLDNAGSAEQVLPLIPPAPSGLALITSRQRLSSLRTEFAVGSVVLDVLDEADAVTLLAQSIGDKEATEGREALAELARLCGRLPLALRIAASKLTAGRQPVRQIVGDLTDQRGRLAELATDDAARSVRAAFASAYHGLSPAAARAFRMLGLHPGATIWPELLATMTGSDLSAARQALAELAATHLVTEVGGRGCRSHDLIRLFASECAEQEETPESRAEAIDRMLSWWVRVAEMARQVPDRDRRYVVATHHRSTPQLPFGAQYDAVLDWLDDHRDELYAAIAYADQHGHHKVLVDLAHLLPWYFDHRNLFADALDLFQRGLRAVEATGTGRRSMLNNVGLCNMLLFRFDVAREYFEAALVERGPDERSNSFLHNNLSELYRMSGDYEGAIRWSRTAIGLARAAGEPHSEAVGLTSLGEAYIKLGQPEVALDYLRQALDRRVRVNDRAGEAVVRSNLAVAHSMLGDYPTAQREFGATLAIQQSLGDRRRQAVTLLQLGESHLARGDHRAAIEAFTSALDLNHALGNRHLEATTLCRLGEVYLAAGDAEGARERLDGAQALRDRIPDPAERTRLARAWDEFERLSGRP